jgi:hypothetical protein
LGSVLACIANLLLVHRSEQLVSRQIEMAGGYIDYALLGFVPKDGSIERQYAGPDWLRRAVYVRLSGSDMNDERLSRLDLERYKHLRGLSIGYEATFGLDGPKQESLPAPISETGLAALPPFPKLRYLNLWDIPTSDIGLRGLARKYPRLEGINLSGTRVTDQTLREIGQLHQLQFLDLQNTRITDAGLSHIGRLKNLKQLCLIETDVVGPGLEHFSALSKLHWLNLADTCVSDEHLRHLARLPRLEHLILWGTCVGDAGARHLASLSELRSLSLVDTSVTDAGLMDLAKLPRLGNLSLDGTPITDAGLAVLSRLPSIQVVSLDNTSVTPTGVEGFHLSRPDCTVFFGDMVLRPAASRPKP